MTDPTVSAEAVATRRASKPFLVISSLVVLAGLAFVIASVVLANSDAAEDASAESVSGVEGIRLAQRSDPWPTGAVAEMIGAGNPDDAISFRADLVGSCMAGHGLEYVDDFDRVTFMLDRLDRDGVAQLGFGLGIDSPPEPVHTSPNSAMLETMTDDEAAEWQATLDQCMRHASETEQSALDDALASLPNDLRREVIGLRFYDHPALAGAIEAWSDCLADAGFHYAHPFAMIESIGADYATSNEPLTVLQARERAIALANYDCRYGILAPAFDDVLADLSERVAPYLPASLYSPSNQPTD